MRIGVFIDNRGISSVDCSNLLNGNPGIGGTAYSILLLCQVYHNTYPNDEVYIYATEVGTFPVVDQVEIIVDFLDALNAASNDKVDLLLIRPVIDSKPMSDELLEEISNKKVPIVTWAHNFYEADFAKKLARNDSIIANVFVGKQEYDYYIDHEIIYKSCFIYNMYPMQDKKIREYNDGKTVTYIGSLVKPKGFHILAKAWKKVIRENPDAQLFVIGSGKLYSCDAKLGRFNIADDKYEKQFMPYLLDDDGRLIPSVHFLGNLGVEKEEYISRTSVGVVNPSGRTETFGISALDFESQGVPVVTIGYVGFLDTIKNGVTGLLYKRSNQIASKIVELLHDNEMNEKFGKAAEKYVHAFEPNIIVKDWNRLFLDIVQNRKQKIKMPDDFYGAQLKWMRILNRHIKNLIQNEKLPAVITIESKIKDILRRAHK